MANDLKGKKVQLVSQRKGFFWAARTRILLWYVILMTFLVGLSIPIFTQLVFVQVDRRVKEDLLEELEAFEEFIVLQTLVAGNKDAAAIFDSFLRYKIPADKTFLIATINGQFYQSSPVGLPSAINRNSKLIKRLAQTTESVRGNNFILDSQEGNILYKAEPLIVDEQVVGVLIIANITAGERQEVLAAIMIVIKVLIAVLIIAVILAWIIAGRVLKPIRSLIKTAREISETDLSQRIESSGRGEMGELAKTFNDMMERLEKSFQTQREFVNDAGHELRTPITIIRGHLELMEDDDPEERKATIELVLDELNRMTRFVEDLILLAKAERREFLQLETVNLETLTEEMYAKAKSLAPRNWQLEAKGQGEIVIDRQRITQAVMNLAQNATQHTTQADTITLGSSIEKQKVCFWVRDTGEGIKPQDQQRIFQRFARASNSFRRSEGAGLGLSIVQAIAQSHNGSIELYSNPGVGSTFTLILPVNLKLIIEKTKSAK